VTPFSQDDAPEIVVVGSANLDLVVTVPTLVRPGETVLATDYQEFVGGKGSNQAIAAARLGRRVALVGTVGRDPAADVVRDALVAEGVDVAGLGVVDGPTGRAFVQVDDRAENSIIVVAGANARLGPADIEAAADRLADAPVVVAQLEIPIEAVTAAARAARGLFVLNPAPAQPLGQDLLGLVDVLVVNEGEFEAIAGVPVRSDLEAMADVFGGSALPARVVITRGGSGAIVRTGDSVVEVPAPTVRVVDTTGAGDTFVGALADALARRTEFPDAVRWAIHAASLSTQSLGATTAMPRAADVEALLAATARR
jgi:ribokinase